MTQTRRTFLQTAGTLAAGTAVAGAIPGIAQAQRRSNGATGGITILAPRAGVWGNPDLHALAAQAVDAAKAAGATYADARLTHVREQGIGSGIRPSADGEWFGVGVRVLVNGYWGFMGSAVWTTDEMVRLAHGAVGQAKANGAGRRRPIELGAPPPVATGEWTMPVKYDPIEVPMGERIDFVGCFTQAFNSYDPRLTGSAQLKFSRQYKVFASSEGSRWGQTTYLTSGIGTVMYQGQRSLQVGMSMMGMPFFSPAGKGWEHVLESGIMDAIPALCEEAAGVRFMTPVEVDRYDAVLAPAAMAALVAPTVGVATELDRAWGYEANAGGTSYLDDPLEMLGTYKVGSSKLNVRADRNTPGAAATVKWDDEGVEPVPFQLVKDGVLVDYQTTREQAATLAPYYQKTNRPVTSHGCASAQSALFVTTQHTPNIRMMPGKDDVSFDDLVRDTKKGIAVYELNVMMDQQQLNGFAYPRMRQITNGKLGRYINGAGLFFRAPDMWKNLVAVGGPSTERWFGLNGSRGQPAQSSVYGVGAVAGKILNFGVVDAFHQL